MDRTVEFKSALPDEWQFAEDGNPVAPGSRGLADEIVAELSEKVSEITPVEQHSYYGWGFETRFEGCRFYHVLNPVAGDCYLTVQCVGYWRRRILFLRPQETFNRYCDVLDHALNNVRGVSDVRWTNYNARQDALWP
jgi:hypothetical protein